MKTRVDLLLNPYYLPLTPYQAIMAFKVKKSPKGDLILEGTRNYTIFELARELRRTNLDGPTIKAILSAHNKENTKPPLEESELDTIIKSSLNYVHSKLSKSNYNELKPISISEFLDEEKFPKPVPIVVGLIHRGELHLITAKAKAGKSWLALGIAYSVSEGVKFLDKFETIKSKVLIIQTEIGPSQIRERAMIIFGDSIKENSDQVLFLNERIKLDTEEGLNALNRLIVEIKPDIIVLDPLYTLHTSNEDSSTEMAPLLSDIRDIAIKNNIAILMIHHQGKNREGGQQTGHKARGSSSFADAPDASWSLEKIEGTSEARLNFEMRNVQAPGPFVCAQNPFNLRWSIIRDIKEKNGTPMFSELTIVEHIKEHPGLKNGEIIDDMVHNFGVSKRKIQKMLASSIDKGKILKKKNGRNFHYFINEMDAKLYMSKLNSSAHKEEEDFIQETGVKNEK